MSDLAFVCVSADLDFAASLADIFETAGHTIGESAENARVAIVIVSREARASGAFLEAARRATDSGKAIVVTRLPLAAHRIDGAPVFDLTAWTGDPDAPGIDPLFSAVDLKLISARFEERGAPAFEEETRPPGFAPPRVHVRPHVWQRGGLRLGGAPRVVAFVAVLGAAALGAGLAIDHHRQEMARLAAASEDDMNVAFADSVLTDASYDDIAPPAPEEAGVRGREPPSAPSMR